MVVASSAIMRDATSVGIVRCISSSFAGGSLIRYHVHEGMYRHNRQVSAMPTSLAGLEWCQNTHAGTSCGAKQRSTRIPRPNASNGKRGGILRFSRMAHSFHNVFMAL